MYAEATYIRIQQKFWGPWQTADGLIMFILCSSKNYRGTQVWPKSNWNLEAWRPVSWRSSTWRNASTFFAGRNVHLGARPCYIKSVCGISRNQNSFLFQTNMKSPFLIGKPSISMGHLYHGYVKQPEGRNIPMDELRKAPPSSPAIKGPSIWLNKSIWDIKEFVPRSRRVSEQISVSPRISLLLSGSLQGGAPPVIRIGW